MSDLTQDEQVSVVDVRPAAHIAGWSAVEIGFRPVGQPRVAVAVDLDDLHDLTSHWWEENVYSLPLGAGENEEWVLDLRAVNVTTAILPWEEILERLEIVRRMPHLGSPLAVGQVRRILIAYFVDPATDRASALRSRAQMHVRAATLSARPQLMEVGVVAPAVLASETWPDDATVHIVPDDASDASVLNALGTTDDAAWDALHLVGGLGSLHGVPTLEAGMVAEAADRVGAWAVAAFDWDSQGRRDVVALADRLARIRPGLAAGIDATEVKAEMDAVEQLIATYEGESTPGRMFRSTRSNPNVTRAVYAPPVYYSPHSENRAQILLEAGNDMPFVQDSGAASSFVTMFGKGPIPAWAAAIQRRSERWDAIAPRGDDDTGVATRAGIAEARRLLQEAMAASIGDDERGSVDE